MYFNSLFWSLKILLWYYTQIQQVIVSKQVVVMWNLRPYHWTFHASLHENPFIYLVLWVHLICVYDFIISCIGHLENIGSLSNVDLPDVDTFRCTIFKILFITSPVISVKSLPIGNLSSPQWLDNTHCPWFSLKWHSLHFWENVGQTSSLNNRNLSLTHSFKKNDVLWSKQVV